MRTVAALALLPVALLTTLGCNPPLEENIAPFVQIISPRTVYDGGEARSIAYADQPLHFLFRIGDRDGDERFEVQLFRDDTPDDPSDTEGLVSLIGPFEAVLDEEVEFVTDEGLPADPQQPQVLELHVDDGRRDGLRVVRLSFDLRQAAAPQICWDGGARCADSGAEPDTTATLEGSLPDADPQSEYYANFWRRQGSTDPAVSGGGARSTLPPTYTARDDVWEYCVQRWASPANADGEPPAPVPDVTLCSAVRITNAPPGPVAHVEAVPASPLPHTPVACRWGEADDADGDPLDYTVTWTDVDGAVLGHGPWLHPDAVLPGRGIRCTVTAHDDLAAGLPSDGTPSTVYAASATPSTLTTNDHHYGTSGETVVLAPSGLVSNAPTPSQHVVALPDRTSPPLRVVDATLGTNAFLRAIDGDPQQTGLGISMSAGDIDGDGLLDLLVGSAGVGAWLLAGGSLTTSASATGMPPAAQHIASTQSGLVRAGSRVLLADLRPASGLEAAIRYDNTLQGRWEIAILSNDDLLGDDLFFDHQLVLRFHGPGEFGAALAAGDVDGDGIEELAVSDPSAAQGTPRVYIFDDTQIAAGFDAQYAAFTVLADSTSTDAARTLAFADLDGDGRDDLIVGDPNGGSDPNGGNGGRVQIFLGTSLAQGVTAPDREVTGVVGFGRAVGAVRDPSGMFGDNLVVASDNAVYLFYGPALFDPHTPSVSELDAAFTVTVPPPEILRLPGPPTDLDGDGFPDLGLLHDTGSGPQAGVFVLSGL